MLIPGAIHSEEAYAQGKMLDHSAWQKGERVLPRGITGSDVDSCFERDLGRFGSIPVFDNRGRIIWIELSRNQARWADISTGQRGVYEGAVKSNPHCAVLCRHSVVPESGKTICTRHDVISFQPMVWDHGFVIDRVFEGNDKWQDFVFSWFDDATGVRRRLLGRSAPKQVGA